MRFAIRYARKPDGERQRIAVYKAANLHMRSAWNQKRVTLIHQRSDGSLSPMVVATLLAAAVDCPYCGQVLGERRSLDHCQPIALGGLHSLTNVLVCCYRCNVSKRALSWSAWLLRLTPTQRALALAARRLTSSVTMSLKRGGSLQLNGACGSRARAGGT